MSFPEIARAVIGAPPGAAQGIAQTASRHVRAFGGLNNISNMPEVAKTKCSTRWGSRLIIWVR
jgi:hypothetical protein